MTVETLETTSAANAPQYSKLAACLLNENGREPLAARFRALFTLRNLADEAAIAIIGRAFVDSSPLLKHELAYVLGQIRNPAANSMLLAVLEDDQQEPMVRHEAAEALGAIGSVESLPVLYRFATHANPIIRETCEIAVDLIQHGNADKDASSESSGIVFGSVDPAPADRVSRAVSDLLKQLMDTSLPLYQRYRAMFALRNKANTDSVLALCEGLKDSSALFRHEIAYVLGQLAHGASVPALKAALENQDEESIVRHECAEALGAIAEPECLEILQSHQQDSSCVVRESCLVALDMYEYETSDQFQYAQPIA